jgi:RNase P subunit RPR2
MGEGFIFLQGKEGKKAKVEEHMKDENGFKERSEEIIREMNAWNASHPKATFLEIEVKARQLVSQLEADLIQASALEREREKWSEREEKERPTCPHCQMPLLWRGKRVRHLQGTAGRDIPLQRTYGTCPKCGTGFFPPR